MLNVTRILFIVNMMINKENDCKLVYFAVYGLIGQTTGKKAAALSLFFCFCSFGLAKRHE